MGPADHKTKKSNVPPKDVNWRKPQKQNAGVKKRKWVPENKFFQGSVKEGQGFAFKRKEKLKHDYNKLMRKEKKKENTHTSLSSLYRETYPEHLKHLYLAEAEKLKNESWTNRVNRSKLRMKVQDREEKTGTEENASPDPEGTGAPEAEDIEKSPSGAQSLPLSNRMKKKREKLSSFQRSQEEYERVQAKRRKKKEEFLMRKQQREEAIRKYKEKKRETFQMLCKKTKKGQPNLNLQMDYLLQKIQKNSETTSKN
ncbi:thyroid transcription factor 1-associated protein 26 homolog [Syngnathoides biaculeatus]|uniref:thyroid transcription factor 1-associated protein 26 homolog n=1 Tax=Syngnathoides biaculeatus TaxID=300417 RepID=UPI002ADE41EA|nr:thyroid transcription factor 1-associated protein 26 homolog [Syngnathoides biaculeatus]